MSFGHVLYRFSSPSVFQQTLQIAASYVRWTGVCFVLLFLHRTFWEGGETAQDCEALACVCVCLHGGASIHSSGQDTDIAFLSILRRLEKMYQAVVLGKKMFSDLSGLYFAF